MTKDILVSISGEHREKEQSCDENEPIEVITPGSYYCKNGKHYILFDEMIDGPEDLVHSRIKITGGDMVEVSKTGATNTHMVFEKNKKNLTYYNTMCGQMLVGIDTRAMEIAVTEDKISVQVDYQLDINQEPLADCRLQMQILPKEKAEFIMNK
jgi:uncharacterized beta-barrel protein YwiB (DUF1934 family)